MKPILLLLLTCIFVVSCSPEDQLVTYLDATVDGKTHLFNTFHTNTETQTENNYTFTDVTVTASIERSPDRLIAFVAEQYLTGEDACWYFSYILDGVSYEKFDDSFVVNIDISSSYRIRGTFSGQLKSPETGQTVRISGGDFDVYFFN